MSCCLPTATLTLSAHREQQPLHRNPPPVVTCLFLLSSSSSIPGARLAGRDPQREDRINPRELRRVPITLAVRSATAELYMVSMAAAGRSPADHFALCHCATRGEDLPVPTEMNVCADNNVRVSCGACRGCGGNDPGEMSRLLQPRAEPGDARSPHPRWEPSQQTKPQQRSSSTPQPERFVGDEPANCEPARESHRARCPLR